MGNIQIIGGGNLVTAFRDLNIAAVKVVQTIDDHDLQVWELSQAEFIKAYAACEE